MGVAENLTKFITEAKFSDLPPSLVHIAKDVILDNLSVTLAGSLEQASQLAANYVRKYYHSGDCSVFGFGFKTSAPMAALVNRVSGHVLDFEMVLNPATHPTSPTLPTILALAETHSFSGQDIITALIYSFEVQGRLRVASASALIGEGFHPPGVVEVMGSVVAAAILLKLPPKKLQMAIGLAGS